MNSTVLEAFKDLNRDLRTLYSAAEAEIMTAWVFEKLFALSKAQIILEKNQQLNSNQIQLLSQAKQALLQHRPIQYVLGETWFYGLRLKVDESVLIPRPETEELVDWCLESLKNDGEKRMQILDIGTGSGCIALALKSRLPDAHIFAVDISEEALSLAKENAKVLRLPIQFLQLDILHQQGWESLPTFDVIVSNPPYITIKEQTSMASHVLKYEPHTALFVQNEDPLQFYKGISDFAQSHLKQDGQLYFEINSEFAAETVAHLKEKGWKVELKKDLQGKNRMIRCMAVPNS